jgi:hypothetical protein
MAVLMSSSSSAGTRSIGAAVGIGICVGAAGSVGTTVASAPLPQADNIKAIKSARMGKVFVLFCFVVNRTDQREIKIVFQQRLLSAQ